MIVNLAFVIKIGRSDLRQFRPSNISSPKFAPAKLTWETSVACALGGQCSVPKSKSCGVSCPVGGDQGKCEGGQSNDWQARKFSLEGRRPNPGWLKSSVWTSQLPYVVQLLDQRTLEPVVEAYGTLDIVPEMAIRNMVSPGPAYSHGGWIDRHVWKIMQAFAAAESALDRVVADFKPSWYERALSWFDKK